MHGSIAKGNRNSSKSSSFGKWLFGGRFEKFNANKRETTTARTTRGNGLHFVR